MKLVWLILAGTFFLQNDYSFFYGSFLSMLCTSLSLMLLTILIILISLKNLL